MGSPTRSLRLAQPLSQAATALQSLPALETICKSRPSHQRRVARRSNDPIRRRAARPGPWTQHFNVALGTRATCRMDGVPDGQASL
jgi:hypothetical protein